MPQLYIFYLHCILIIRSRATFGCTHFMFYGKSTKRQDVTCGLNKFLSLKKKATGINDANTCLAR